MRILVTNDDGINAPGLKVAEELAYEITGGEGEIWIVAPAFEQSGAAHKISYVDPLHVSKLAEKRYSADGTPADCVIAAIHEIMPEKPDLVLSGVNRGNNSGENAVYSGTLGAAMEGALQGIPAIALSQYMGPALRGEKSPFSAARRYGTASIQACLQAQEAEAVPYKLFFNVNFPPFPADQVLGLRAAPQGTRHGARFKTVAQSSPSGRKFLWLQGGDQRSPADQGSDVAFNLAGYVSITPMRADLTAQERLPALKEALA